MPRSPMPALESVLVDHLGARGIDEVAARLHGSEELRAQQAARLRVERQMYADDIGSRGHFRRRCLIVRCPIPRPVPESGCGSMPPLAGRRAFARGSISRPICPSPIRPNVRPKTPRAFEYSPLFHCPWRSVVTLSAMRRSSARINPNASSATATEFFPGSSTHRCRGAMQPPRRWCCIRPPRAPPVSATPLPAPLPRPWRTGPPARRGWEFLYRFRERGVLGRGLIGYFASGGGQAVQAGLFELIGYKYAHGISVSRGWLRAVRSVRRRSIAPAPSPFRFAAECGNRNGKCSLRRASQDAAGPPPSAH